MLDAAEKIFAEYGFKGATTQMIADYAGIPKANLHYYFPTKEALYSQVVQNIFDIWLEAADSFDQRWIRRLRLLVISTKKWKFHALIQMGPRFGPTK